jgi:hypothetical protein
MAMYCLLFFVLTSILIPTRAGVPVSECPDATVLHAEWGRFLMYDLTDNGLLDASILYGLTPDITAALLQNGVPPFMSLTSSGYLPRLCNTSIITKPSNACPVDNIPCCGDPRCSETPEMQTIFTFLLREHNAFITKTSKGEAAHDPHLFILARNHIISILASTCPSCRGPEGICVAGVAADLIALFAFSTPLQSTCPAGAGVIICDDNTTLAMQTPIMQVLPPNGTLSVESLNFSYYLEVTHTPLDLSLNAQVVAFFEGYYGVDGNATSLLVYLLSERHGPGEEDIVGRLGHALFAACFGPTNPPWINNAAVRKIISQFYETTCPIDCTLDSADLAGLASSDPSSTSSGNEHVQEGSLIFFVVMIGVLVVALFTLVMYKLFT